MLWRNTASIIKSDLCWRPFLFKYDFNKRLQNMHETYLNTILINANKTCIFKHDFNKRTIVLCSDNTTYHHTCIAALWDVIFISFFLFLCLIAYLSSYHEKAINALYELA